ncbi:hypothetical protein [Staphylococcus epidermidis]|uniref:hypothetical protein n=1 Tax=Staphylococcus epidermidis TaxID=1282 RepID=UPI00371BCD71
MKRLRRVIYKREHERNKRHDELLAIDRDHYDIIELLIKRLKSHKKRFISVAKHYIERINNDNLKL